MSIDFQFAYLIGNAIFAVVWLALFLLRKDLRVEMLAMSIVVAPLGPVSELFYLRDYWQPELFNGWRIGIEDALFGFFIGGIAAVLYEELVGKRHMRRKGKGHPYWMMGFAVLAALWMVIGTLILNLNSIYVSVVACLFAGVGMLVIRKDLIADAILSGLSVGALMLCFYLIYTNLFDGIIQEWWMLENISGVLILDTPLEELMWGFAWGFVAGPAYEFITGVYCARKR